MAEALNRFDRENQRVKNSSVLGSLRRGAAKVGRGARRVGKRMYVAHKADPKWARNASLRERILERLGFWGAAGGTGYLGLQAMQDSDSGAAELPPVMPTDVRTMGYQKGLQAG